MIWQKAQKNARTHTDDFQCPARTRLIGERGSGTEFRLKLQIYWPSQREQVLLIHSRSGVLVHWLVDSIPPLSLGN